MEDRQAGRHEGRDSFWPLVCVFAAASIIRQVSIIVTKYITSQSSENRPFVSVVVVILETSPAVESSCLVHPIHHPALFPSESVRGNDSTFQQAENDTIMFGIFIFFLGFILL